MSATVVVPDLNDEQVQAVITEALSRGYFERGVDGQLPDKQGMQEAATELIRQCKLAFNAGNRSDGVMQLLFIAEIDQNPSTTQGDSLATQEQDLSNQSTEALHKFEQALLNYEPQTDEVAENLRQVRAELERRGVAVAAAAPEPVNGGASVESNGNGSARKALEDRLTFSMMRNHGVDPSEVGSLSDTQLQWIIEHPGGEEGKSAAPPQEVGETVETTHVVVEQPAVPASPPTPATVAEVNSLEISPEREELESQITGPLLKAYGRGRKDVLTIGDNELRFMLEHPDGRVTKEQLLAARAQDQDAQEGSTPAGRGETTEDQPPSIAEQMRAENGSSEGFAPPSEEPPAEAPKPEVIAPQPAETPKPAPQPPRQESKPLLKELPSNPAQEIIDSEHFPIPPELDESPPRLPFDMSKESDGEVMSLHARLHACHSRANYVVGLWESRLRDTQKLRRGREVAVANDLPLKDGRTKYTDAQREAMVQADEEVVDYREREHEIERVLRQLQLLRDNYGRDVSTSSRQMSMRAREAEGAR